MSLASLASGAAATVTAVVVGVVSCSAPLTQPTQDPAGSFGSVTDPASTSATDEPITDEPITHEPAAGGPTDGLVPVYYMADVDGRFVLFREYHAVTVAQDTLVGSISAAVTEMLDGAPLDPDYRTGWPPAASLRSVRIDGDVAVVDLAGAGINNVGAEAEARTFQQLVYTVTAAAYNYDRTSLRGVRVLHNGTAQATWWGHVDNLDRVLTRDSSAVAPVWLSSPQHGARVSSPVRVQISATAWEGVVTLQAINSSGAVVVNRAVQLSAGAPARGEASVQLNLAPGKYTLKALYESMEDGSPRGVDDHTITVG